MWEGGPLGRPDGVNQTGSVADLVTCGWAPKECPRVPVAFQGTASGRRARGSRPFSGAQQADHSGSPCSSANASMGRDGVKPHRQRGIQGPLLNAPCEMCRWRKGASSPAVAAELRSQPTARCRLGDHLDSLCPSTSDLAGHPFQPFRRPPVYLGCELGGPAPGAGRWFT